jgi:hypothetical protein
LGPHQYGPRAAYGLTSPLDGPGDPTAATHGAGWTPLGPTPLKEQFIMAYTEAVAGLTTDYAEIRQVEGPTPEEECALVAGAGTARDRLVEANLRLVTMITREFAEGRTRFIEQPNKLPASSATYRRSMERIAI